MKKSWILLLLVVVLVSGYFKFTRSPAHHCIYRRAAFDIGSDRVKMKVADVDRCLGQVVKLISDVEQVVPLTSATDSNGGIPDDAAERAIEALRYLKLQAVNQEALSFAAVATAAFREAKNGIETVKRMQEELALPITIVDQKQEGVIGFLGVTESEGLNPQSTLVWYLGDDHMQLTMQDPNGQFQVYQNHLGGQVFKDYLIKSVKEGGGEFMTSPNPLSRSEIQEGQKHVVEASEPIPQLFRTRIESADKIVAIGSIHYEEIRNQLGRADSYGPEEIKLAIRNLSGKNDSQLGGLDPSTRVSNLVLALGYMNALNMDKVEPRSVNLPDGLLIHRGFWENSEDQNALTVAQLLDRFRKQVF